MGNRTTVIGCATAAFLALSVAPAIPLEMQCPTASDGLSCMQVAEEPTVEDIINLMMYGDDPLVIKAVINTIAGPDAGPDHPNMIVASN